ncbi:MAG: hypothetical protein NC314_08835 [Roseburia sp.]|nr:hypothetical protein [Roseburia sp.]MCM1242932.1 hypothetical protein [Roseburia sp.]
MQTSENAENIMPEAETTVRLEFTKEEFLADYDHMWKILQENYLFFDILEERGIDVESLRQKTRQQIVEQDMDLDDFMAALDSLFRNMQYFAHLGLLPTESYDVMYEYSADTFCAFCKATGWATVVGERTMGDGKNFLTFW